MADLGAVGVSSPVAQASVATPAGGTSNVGAALKVALPMNFDMLTDSGVAAGLAYNDSTKISQGAVAGGVTTPTALTGKVG